MSSLDNLRPSRLKEKFEVLDEGDEVLIGSCEFNS